MQGCTLLTHHHALELVASSDIIQVHGNLAGCPGRLLGIGLGGGCNAQGLPAGLEGSRATPGHAAAAQNQCSRHMRRACAWNSMHAR